MPSLSNDYKNVVICTLLLNESLLKLGEYEDFQEKYREAREAARLNNVDYGGVEIADSEYRIGRELLNNP